MSLETQSIQQISSERVVLGIIENELHEICLIKRMVKEGPLLLSFPGGRQEPEDESDFATAVREAWEEVRLRVEPIRIIGERLHPDSQRWIVYVHCRTTELGQVPEVGPEKEQTSIRETFNVRPKVGLEMLEEQGSNVYDPNQVVMIEIDGRWVMDKVEEVNPVSRIDPTRRKRLERAS